MSPYPVYLLLFSAWLVGFAESAIGNIDCSSMREEKSTEQTWKCSYDGSAECGETVTDCSDCEDEGWITGGTANYDGYGNGLWATGGWDCSYKCNYRQASSGSQSKWKSNYCGFYYKHY